jgi:putative ABC transport system permease protein
MLKSYLKLLFRDMWKNKFFSILNMTGLAIGMTCYLLIFKYAAFEISYDSFHSDSDNIYRVQRDVYENNVLKNSYARDSYNLGPALKETFPEIIDAARGTDFPSNSVSYGEQTFRDEKIYVTESSFLNIFSFPLLKGDPATALSNPNSILLSQSTARKYFGSDDPMGKTLKFSTKGQEYSCMVVGVFRDVPVNSSLQFDMLMSMSTIWNAAYSDWAYFVFHTYLLTTPGTDAEALEAKLPAFVKDHILQHVPRAANWKLLLQPFKDIYLYSDLTYDTKNGDGKIVYFLLIIAFLILVISWINYVNLSTARAMERGREVGIRKVLGGNRTQLIRQFLAESLLVNIIPLIVAVVLFIIFIPYLRELTGKNIPLSPGDMAFWLNLLALYAAGSLLSGLYPAFVLSSFKPITVLKRSKLSQTTGGALLRKILVTFQFAAAVILIIVTFTVYRQIEYMRSKDLGIDMGRVMVLSLPSTPLTQQYNEKVTALRTELLRYPGIEGITGSSAVPGSAPEARLLCWKQNTTFKDGQILSIISIDYDFIPTYGLKLLKGRNFSKEFGSDTWQAVIANEAAVKLLDLGGIDSALGQGVSLWQVGENFKIVGIIKDYHHQSLKNNYDPIVFLLRPGFRNYYSIKLGASDIREAIGTVKAEWDEIFPGYPFDYFFLDDHFDRQYQADRQFGRVLGMFVLLTVIITCLGLLGLSYFTAYQRTKEIGIRKTFGAGILEILVLLTQSTVKLIVIATVAAWPIAFLVIDRWLKSYAYRIGIPFEFFILSGILVTLVALLTVAYHSFIAARANPIHSLREE